MSEQRVDEQVLAVMTRLLILDDEAARLLQRVWSDRAYLTRGVTEIRDWDVTHAEALTLNRAQNMIRDMLDYLERGR